MGPNNEKGFSLLELIVVLILVSLMAGLVAPRLAGSLTRMNLRTSAQKICSLLRYARSQAAAEKVTYMVTFDFEKRSCFIQKKNIDAEKKGGENYLPADDPAVAKKNELKSYLLPDGVEIEKGIVAGEEVDSEIFMVEFYPGGNSSGGDIILNDEKENRYRVRVDFITGMVKVLDEEPSKSYL